MARWMILPAVMLLPLLIVELTEAQRQLPPGVILMPDVEYGKGGDTTLLLDIYKPQDPIATPTPAIIWIHGGGWQGGSKSDGGQAAMLAAQGFFAVSIDYRLSGVAKFPAAVEDCKCAVRWLRAHADEYGVDPDRIGTIGGSAGAHLAMMLGCTDETAGLEGTGGWEGVSSKVQCVVSYFGPTDISRGPQELESGRGDAPRAFIGGEFADMEEAYRKASPVLYVSAGDPPLLMVHGDQDQTVPLDQSQRMLKAYQDAGLEAELVVVKGAGHGFGPREGVTPTPNPREIGELTVSFFKEHLVAGM